VEVRLDGSKSLRRRWLVNIPTIIFIVVIVASLILGVYASLRASQAAGTSNQVVYVEVIVSGHTTYTTTITTTSCTTGKAFVVVQPIVIEHSNVTITTTTTYTTTHC
jgi:hypothetical protein